MVGKTIVCMGLANVDYLATMPRYPAKNSKSRLSTLVVDGGGPAATAAVAAAKLGVPTRFVGKVGPDDFGRQILAGLSREGVDVSRTVIAPSGASPYSFVVIDQSDASRTIFHWRDLPPLTVEEVDWSCLDDAAVLLADCRQMDTQIEAARAPSKVREATPLARIPSFRDCSRYVPY
jgi:sulfofructose kinase